MPTNNTKEEKNKKLGEKYLSNTIGLIQASVEGSIIGANFAGLEGKQLHYDHGTRIRAVIESDIKKLFKYAYNLGKKSK